MLIESLEMFSGAIGSILLWRSTVTGRFRNYTTSVFLLCYVPLFCIYPVIGRWLAGGAISIDANFSETISGSTVYFVYQGYNLVILAGFLFTSSLSPVSRNLTNQSPIRYSIQVGGLFAGLCLGLFLYVYSTGLSITELLIASRFEWFRNDNYSSLLSVTAAYFVALTPALVYHLAKDNQLKMLAVTLFLLIGYGALSKDRKWLIFIASGLFAASYIRMQYEISLRGRHLIWLSLLAVALTFWQVARGLLFSSLVADDVDLVSEVPLMMEKLLTRGDLPYYYNASMTAIEMNFNRDFSIPLGLLRRQLFFFLPNSYSFGLKPEDISAIFSDAVSGGDELRRGNMPPGLIGHLVLSFEWWGGWIVGFGLPFALRLLDNLIRRSSGVVQITVISSTLSCTLLLLRGDDSSAVYFIIFTILFLLFLKIPMRFIRLKKSFFYKSINPVDTWPK